MSTERTAVRYSKEEDAELIKILALKTGKDEAFNQFVTNHPTRTVGGAKYRAGVLKKVARKVTSRPERTTAPKAVTGATALQMRTVEMVVPHLNDEQRLSLIGHLLK